VFDKLWELLKKKPVAPAPVAAPVPAPKPSPEKPVEAPKPSRRRVNQAGQDLIKAAESLELEAYPDPASPLGVACTKAKLLMRSYRKVAGWEKLKGDPWTIGWGHTGAGTVQGLSITQETAQALMESDLEEFEKGVESLVKTKISDNQFGAMVSFAYNCGLANLEKSTLLKKVNAGDLAGAADEFLKWANVKEKDANGVPTGKLIPLKGLVIRRGAEKDLFLKP
jgi:lysozyme